MSANRRPVPAPLQILPTEQIVPNDRNPRLIFPRGELDVLAESIDQVGILVPVTVYEKDGRYVLIDGERRFKCALELNLSEVPALITDEKPDIELLQQMFNIHLIREPWQDMPTARALKQLVEHVTASTGSELPTRT